MELWALNPEIKANKPAASDGQQLNHHDNPTEHETRNDAAAVSGPLESPDSCSNSLPFPPSIAGFSDDEDGLSDLHSVVSGITSGDVKDEIAACARDRRSYGWRIEEFARFVC
jgi:hypothetical protein